MNIQDKINAMEFANNRELVQGLYDALKQAIVIPNSCLPERMHEHKSFEVGSVGCEDGKVYGKTIDRIEKILAKERETSELKAEKEKRVAKYAAQVAETGEFEYDSMVDSNMVKFLEKLAN